MKIMMTMRTMTLFLGVMVMTGCATHSKKTAEMRNDFISGDHDKALEFTSKQIKKSGGGTDSLVWQLEHATILRTAERIDESAEEFEIAHEMYMKNLDEGAKIRLSAGIDLLTTPANSRYWGTGYDGLMINLYQTLNALQQGDLQFARVNITRSYLLQQEIVANNAARIEKEQEALAKDEKATAGTSDERNQKLMADANADALSGMDDVRAELKAYADYVNPFAVWLDGLFSYVQGDGNGARLSFERVRAFAPNNAAVKADYEAVNAGQAIKPSVYVVFETGMAPYLEEKKFEIWLPSLAVLNAAAGKGAKLPTHIGVAYPGLVTTPSGIPHIVVTTPKAGATQRIMSMDAVIGREFNNNFPGIMAKAIASAITKTVAQILVNAAAEKSGNKWVSMGTQLVTGVASAATTVADTRSWQTLPKEFQVLRCDMPEDRIVTLTTPGGWSQTVNVMDGDVVVIYVKAIGMAVSSVNQFTLGGIAGNMLLARDSTYSSPTPQTSNEESVSADMPENRHVPTPERKDVAVVDKDDEKPFVVDTSANRHTPNSRRNDILVKDDDGGYYVSVKVASLRVTLESDWDFNERYTMPGIIVAVGNRLSSSIRGEGEVVYATKGDANLTTLMGWLYGELPLKESCISFYANVGIGAANHKARWESAKNTVCLGMGFGAVYSFNENFAFDIAYRYVGSSRSKMLFTSEGPLIGLQYAF